MLLTTIFLTLLIGIIFLFFIPNTNINLLRACSIGISSIILLISSFIVLKFDGNIYYFQYFTSYNIGSKLFNLNYTFGLDGISLFFFFLSSLLIFLCIVFINNEKHYKEYIIILFVIEFFLFVIFSALDLFIFYMFFEAILIPMFILIGAFGSRARKIRANYMFFFYTFCGSLMMLIGILYIFSILGTLNLEYILTWNPTENEQMFLWLAFFFAFASKIPVFPFHIWLPEAHVEAPTVGSVLLAGILLKLGVYGFLRFSLTLFPEASLYFSPLVYLLSILGVIYASITAIRQTDLKRIIAYSSVAHMNLVTLGLFSFNLLGLEGALIQSISHGFVSGGMFLIIGILYDRYHSRQIAYYGGLVHVMPIYSIFFLIFTFANIAVPGTSSFVGEFMILSGVYQFNAIACILSGLGIILSAGYSLWLYNRIIFGNLKTNYTLEFSDMSFKEITVLAPLFFFIFLMGFYPSFFSEYFHLSINNISFLSNI